jgi:uncharacterized membrane protein YwzB
MVMVLALMSGIGELILGSAVIGIVCLVIFAFSLWWTLRRFQEDYEHEIKAYGHHP